MLTRLLFVIAGIALIGAALLSLRQHRSTMLHVMSDLHVQMDHDRKATWDAQADIAEHTHPLALRGAVARAGLDLEPMPTDPNDHPRTESEFWPSPDRFAHAPYPGRSDPAAVRAPLLLKSSAATLSPQGLPATSPLADQKSGVGGE